MSRRRSSGVILDHIAISWRERWQPSQRPLRGSMWQTPMQGVSILELELRGCDSKGNRAAIGNVEAQNRENNEAPRRLGEALPAGSDLGALGQVGRGSLCRRTQAGGPGRGRERHALVVAFLAQRLQR